MGPRGTPGTLAASRQRGKRPRIERRGGAGEYPLLDGFDRLLAGVEAMRLAPRLDFLTVSVPPSFGARWPVPRLERLRRAHPEFDVRIDANDALASFATDGVDVAIRYGTGRYPPAVSECLMKIDAFPVCAPWLLTRGKPIRPDDLARFTLLHASSADASDAAPGWPMWLRAAGARGVDAEPGPRFSNDAMLVEAALAGQGVALASDALVARELAAGRLVRPFPPATFERTVFCYWLVYPERHRETPKVRAFRDWLFAEIEVDAGVD